MKRYSIEIMNATCGPIEYFADEDSAVKYIQDSIIEDGNDHELIYGIRDNATDEIIYTDR